MVSDNRTLIRADTRRNKGKGTDARAYLDIVLVSTRSFRFRQDELDTSQVVVSSRQALQGATFGIENATFARRVELELDSFGFRPRFGDFQGDAEPMAVRRTS